MLPKSIVWCLLGVLLGLSVAACSGSDSAATPMPSPPSATPLPTATPPVEAPTATTTPTTTPPATTPTPLPARVVQPGSPFELGVTETVEVDGTGWRITLVAITEDSRCPVDVVCVWAGQITAAFVAENTDGRFDLEITLGPLTTAEAVVNGYRVTLLEVNPRPVSTIQISPQEYGVTVVVEREGTPNASSGIFGTVTQGPMCPVVRQGQPCPDQPYDGLILVEDSSGNEVARTSSGLDGRYLIALTPGTYTLSPQKPADNILPVASDMQVEVGVGQWVVADISYDTGIR